MPSYLKDLFNSYVPERVLRSQDSKSNLKTFGDRALIIVTGPIIFNKYLLSFECYVRPL